MYPEKFTQDSVIATFLLHPVVIITFPVKMRVSSLDVGDLACRPDVV